MRMRSRYLPVSGLVLFFMVAAFIIAPRSHAQDPPQTPPAGGQAQGQGQERPGRPEQTTEPRPYDRVITKDAKSDPGIFTIHTIKRRFTTRFRRANSTKSFFGSARLPEPLWVLAMADRPTAIA